MQELKLEFFGDDIQQYGLLPGYVSKLRQNDRDVILEMEDKQFNRMQIVFHEGKQVFKSYAQIGLCLDGTFLKNMSGGILLVVCVLNGNQQIRLYPWSLFLLKMKLIRVSLFGIWMWYFQ